MAALEGASAILIVGPATAKMEFAKYIRAHNSALARAIEGVETVNHPTEGELLNLAYSFFKRAGRLPGQTSITDPDSEGSLKSASADL